MNMDVFYCNRGYRLLAVMSLYFLVAGSIAYAGEIEVLDESEVTEEAGAFKYRVKKLQQDMFYIENMGRGRRYESAITMADMTTLKAAELAQSMGYKYFVFLDDYYADEGDGLLMSSKEKMIVLADKRMFTVTNNFKKNMVALYIRDYDPKVVRGKAVHIIGAQYAITKISEKYSESDSSGAGR